MKDLEKVMKVSFLEGGEYLIIGTFQHCEHIDPHFLVVFKKRAQWAILLCGL